MGFIAIPNLPQKDVCLVAASGTYTNIVDALRKKKIRVIETGRCKNLADPVCSHADMLCHHFGERFICVAKEEVTLQKELAHWDFQVFKTCCNLQKEYPKDVLLNAARIGNLLFANSNCIDPCIIDFCSGQGIKIVAVKQGYSKCSIAVINENAIITEDAGIAASALKVGIDVLKLGPGHIAIDGYPYGFIGGCCGFIGNRKLAFTGKIKSHPEHDLINCFLNKYRITAVELTDEQLIDIGGILPLME